MTCFERYVHQRLHQHRVLGVGRDVSALVGAHRVNLVYFIFGKAKCTEVTDPKRESNDDQQRQHTPYFPGQPTVAAGGRQGRSHLAIICCARFDGGYGFSRHSLDFPLQYLYSFHLDLVRRTYERTGRLLFRANELAIGNHYPAQVIDFTSSVVAFAKMPYRYAAW